MHKYDNVEIVLLSSGHSALDHRVFDKEATTLARYFSRVRVVAAHTADEVLGTVRITALSPTGSRLKRFLFRPLHCYLAARGSGKRIAILHDAELLLWAPFFKIVMGWRLVYDVHEDFPQLLLRRTWIPARLRRSLGHGVGIMEQILSRSCDGIIGATAVLADHFAPQARIALYNLPSRDFISKAASQSRPLDERKFDLVHLGTLSNERMEFLGDVFAHLFAQTPSAHALVIGAQPEQARYFQQRFSPDRVATVGKVSYDQILGYLVNCRIGIDIHPVLYPHLRCAVPVKVFEYMAAGCNVVTSYLPELHRLLGDEGAEHVVTIYTPAVEAFAGEIARLLDEPASMLEHQRALMRLVNIRWNWEHEAEKLVQFVTRINQGEELVSREQVLDH